MEAARIAELHAYVDDCLEPDERLAFEAQMAQDPALTRQAAQWRAQNSAIRAAFDGESAKAFSISIVRPQSEPFGRAKRAAATGGKASPEPPLQAASLAVVDGSRLSAAARAPGALRGPLLWRLGLASLALGLVVVWAPAATVAPARQLAAAGVAAFQAFARPGVAPVELATSEGAEAETWLTARLGRPIRLPAAPAAIRLVGAWVAPYPGAPAAFLVLRSPDGALGLLIRPLDAPEATAPRLIATDGHDAAVWTERGQGLALVGDPDAATLMRIATELAGPPA